MMHALAPLPAAPETHGWTAGNRLQIIAGPCVVEGEDLVMRTAERVVETGARLGLPVIFKASYRKANRSRIDSFTGIGDEAGLEILRRVSERFEVPVTTDIHSAEEAALAAQYVDILQIPAFLCRQTDLLLAAAATDRIVNIKKGQFVAPEAMRFAVDKVKEGGNPHVWLTERGSMFGYTDLVVDVRGIPTMRAFAPVIADVTHSLQQPNSSSGVTGGRPELIATVAAACVAAGADGVFVETHPDPSCALSDGANMLPLDLLPALLERLVRVFDAVRS